MMNSSFSILSCARCAAITVLATCVLVACGQDAEPTATEEQASYESTYQRRLPLAGAANARDMGGYTTTDGRTVRWGVLYRADGLHELSDADVAYLEKLELAVVTDFRSESERAGAPDRLPELSPPIAYRTLSINDPAVDVAELGRKVYAGVLSEAELIALTDRRSYVENTETSRIWGQWVAELAEPGKLPHLFHCTAGKDRTGFAAALVLLTLGVPKEQVMEDFLLSNEYLDARIEEGIRRIQADSESDIDADVLRLVLGVSPASLEGAIEAMESQYGSVDKFIERGLGIDATTRARLRELLLE